MNKISFKTKSTLIFPLAITVTLAAILFLTYFQLQNYVKESISSQQFQTVSILADGIDQKLLSTQKPLLALSRKITSVQISDPDEALGFLLERTEFSSLFDNGMFLFDSRGRIIAELPLGVSRAGKDFSFREYLKVTFATKAPYISDPYISSQSHHHPAIMMTAPILDRDGNILAVLGGSIDLMKADFLGDLNSRKIGRTGYLFLFSKDRVIISHPDPERILKQDIPLGANKLLDRAINGFNGTDDTVNSRGRHFLSSFKHLKVKDWIIGANYPVTEAYEPSRRLRNAFIIILPILSFAFFWFTRRYLNHFTDPIIRFTRHVEELGQKNDRDRLFPAESVEELAVLAQAFNCLISQLDQQKEELLEQEVLYRTVVDFSNEMVFWITADRLTIHYVSPSCQELTGYTPEEYYSAPHLLHDIIYTDDLGLWDENCRMVCSSDLSESLELRIVTKTGDIRWVNHLCREVIDHQGENAGFRGSFRDITASKLAAQQLYRQNEYLQALHETTLGLIRRQELSEVLQAIVIRAGNLVGTEHCYLYLKNSVGTEMDMVFQDGIYENLVHHSILPGEGLAGRVWITGEPFHVDDYSQWGGRLPDRDRDLLHAMAGVPLKVGDDVVGVLGLAFIDTETAFNEEQMILLTQFGELASLALENARLNEASQRELAERKRVEERLRKLSVAVEQSPVSIVITDTFGKIEYVNPHFTKLTGYSSEEAVGKNPSILKTGETSSDEYRQLWETVLSGVEWRGEFHNRKKDGELYWEQALIAPIRDEQGIIKHFIAIKENITERKILERQLQHSQKMEAIGQLAGGISHDFNNILAAIIGFSTIIQLKLPADSPLANIAKQLTATAERGSSLTQGLLAFSRKQDSNPVVMDLNEILDRIQQLLLRLISADIDLEINMIAQKLPVMADSVQIEQILMNLATNARDALPNGGSIVITTEIVSLDSDFVLARGFGQPGEYAMLTFSDNGLGIDSDIVKHIFEPFYTTKDHGKGTGLGLSIVYGIIKKQNGYITCQSKVGSGTTFHIYLPLLDECPVQAETPPLLHEPDQGRSEVVLLAEDDKLARMVSTKILEEFGYTVIAAANGLEAVELFNSNPDRIDLMILDFIMPGLNGLQVFHSVRATKPEVKVLFCSGYTEDDIVNQGGFVQGTNLILKPYTPKELLMKIREVLDNGA